MVRQLDQSLACLVPVVVLLISAFVLQVLYLYLMPFDYFQLYSVGFWSSEALRQSMCVIETFLKATQLANLGSELATIIMPLGQKHLTCSQEDCEGPCQVLTDQ